MENVEFYRCPTCGNVITVLTASSGRLICCGAQMVKLVAKTNDLGTEKHTPVIEHEGGKLIAKCGSNPHPMVENHYIMWMALVTDNRCEIVYLHTGEEPKAEWCDVEHGTVYAYCNLHSLWATSF
jgi:superoxide reductase